jgi:hypothetical protein
MVRIAGALLALFLARPAGAAPAPPGDAASWELSLAAGPGRLAGETRYRIGGAVEAGGLRYRVQDPLSVLVFPLEATVAGGEISLLAPGGRMRAALSFFRSPGGNGGTATDLDYGYWYLAGGSRFSSRTLDIRGTARSDLEALGADLRLLFPLGRAGGWSLEGGGAYAHRRFGFSLRDLEQGYPSAVAYFGREIPPQRVAGRVMTYRATYREPGLLLRGTYRPEESPLRLSLTCGVSRVLAEDRDDHLLRTKLARGRGEGWGFRWQVGAWWDLPRGWFLSLDLAGRRLDARGTQTQEWYGPADGVEPGTRVAIGQRLEERERTASLLVGRRFSLGGR